MPSLGVYPVFDIEFLISTSGKTDLKKESLANMVKVADMETFELSIDGNVEEWSPMDTKGWVRRLMTGKGFSISLAGKRHEGDPGNDFIAQLALSTGGACSTTSAIKFPNGDIMIYDCVVNVSKNFGGASTDVNALECELMSDGKPEYIKGTSV